MELKAFQTVLTREGRTIRGLVATTSGSAIGLMTGSLLLLRRPSPIAFHTSRPHSPLNDPGIAIASDSISASSVILPLYCPFVSTFPCLCLFHRKLHLSLSHVRAQRFQRPIRILILVSPPAEFLDQIPDKARERILVWRLRIYHGCNQRKDVHQYRDPDWDSRADPNCRINVQYGRKVL